MYCFLDNERFNTFQHMWSNVIVRISSRADAAGNEVILHSGSRGSPSLYHSPLSAFIDRWRKEKENPFTQCVPEGPLTYTYTLVNACKGRRTSPPRSMALKLIYQEALQDNSFQSAIQEIIWNVDAGRIRPRLIT